MGIKPCPFCGSHGVTLAENVGVKRKYYVQCDCLAQGPHCHTEDDAVKAWNIVIADLQREEAKNARLEEALRGMMEATEAVDEWKSGEAPSFLGGYAFDLVKAARTKAREVLSDASPTASPPD